jgi:hypothetical protein
VKPKNDKDKRKDFLKTMAYINGINKKFREDFMLTVRSETTDRADNGSPDLKVSSESLKESL